MIPKLKEFRESKGIKQKEMAAMLNISKTTLSGWENGHDIIPLKRLVYFSNYFKVSIDYLIGTSKNDNYVELEINRERISKILLETRKNNNKTQQAISKVLNISTGTYCDYEKGNHLISTTSLISLAGLYNNFSLDYLLKKEYKEKTGI